MIGNYNVSTQDDIVRTSVECDVRCTRNMLVSEILFKTQHQCVIYYSQCILTSSLSLLLSLLPNKEAIITLLVLGTYKYEHNIITSTAKFKITRCPRMNSIWQTRALIVILWVM